MKIYIGVCGLGLGHVFRCLNLAEKARARGFKVIFSTYSGEASRILREGGFKTFEAPPLSYSLNFEGDVDFKLTLAKGPFELQKLALHVALELKNLMRERADVVLSDSRLSTTLSSYISGIPSILILNQLKINIPRRRPIGGLALRVKEATERLGCEILGIFWNRADKVLLADFPPPYTISRGSVHIPERLKHKVRFVGPLVDYEKYSYVSKDEAKKRLGLNARHLILTSVGGRREEVVGILKKVASSFKDVEGVEVIVSASIPGNGGMMSRKGSVSIYRWIPNKHEYLKASDLLITHGGQTSIAEAICTSTPMLIIPRRGHTERVANAKSMEKLGIAKTLFLEEVSIEKLREVALEMVSDPTYYERALKLAREVERFKAVDEVLHEIESLSSRAFSI